MRKDRLEESDVPNEYNMTSFRIKLSHAVDAACYAGTISTIHSSGGRKVALIPYTLLTELLSLREAQKKRAGAANVIPIEQAEALKDVRQAMVRFAKSYHDMMVTREGNTSSGSEERTHGG